MTDADLDKAVKAAIDELGKQAGASPNLSVNVFGNQNEGVPYGGWVVIAGDIDLRSIVRAALTSNR